MNSVPVKIRLPIETDREKMREEGKEESLRESQDELTSIDDTPQKDSVISDVEEVPTKLIIDITPELYFETKKKLMDQIHAAVRPLVELYFDWLVDLDPDDVVDALEYQETIADKYREYTSLPTRIAVGTGRAFVKNWPSLRKKARNAMNMKVTIFTLRFENPVVYQIIKSYGPEGGEWLERNLQDVKVIIGLEEEKEEEET